MTRAREKKSDGGVLARCLQASSRADPCSSVACFASFRIALRDDDGADQVRVGSSPTFGILVRPKCELLDHQRCPGRSGDANRRFSRGGRLVFRARPTLPGGTEGVLLAAPGHRGPGLARLSIGKAGEAAREAGAGDNRPALLTTDLE